MIGFNKRDNLTPFRLEKVPFHGYITCLTETLESILPRHNYPFAVNFLLTELITLTVLLSGSFKIKGVFTLQIKVSGPIDLMVCDVNHEGHVRAYAHFQPGNSKLSIFPIEEPKTYSKALFSLLGEGHLYFTLDQGRGAVRHQGIVGLKGPRLSDCLHHYFQKSVQLDTAMEVVVLPSSLQKGVRFQACGVMVQKTPSQGEGNTEPSEDNQAWKETLILLKTLSPSDLDPQGFSGHTILPRLFHGLGVRVWDPLPLKAGCRCSLDKVKAILAALNAQEKEKLSPESGLTVKCEFCGREYGVEH